MHVVKYCSHLLAVYMARVECMGLCMVCVWLEKCQKIYCVLSNKTDISYLKTSQFFFYINHPTEGCAQQQVTLS